ncbi:sulfurtransferase [Corynebacterium sp. TAE3-ERU12]|uniref:sulfurtransferase n=1 Tax=Corynebacterium sp. TAE3-ERU12 TaxID=2849491 RepID=UPI001C48BA5E|nr:rhodanese-like domain-containing protein [Corynebacterium sp. TAE3-ERU12]MBV7295999.1 sulfurtransferase [Corynebacterium sp. TAE3-ERU12]
MSTCLTPRELRDLIRSGTKAAIIDARWTRFGRPYSNYAMAHIPLALYCDPVFDLAGIPDRQEGRNPLPEVDQIRRAVRRWGLQEGQPVVVYDDGDGQFAARAWWLLTWAGISGVRTLDGGMRAWEDAGFQTAGGPGNLPHRGDLVIRPGSMPTVDIDQVRSWPAHGVLIDSRQQVRFSGSRERLDLQAGHIPGAVNIPAEEFVKPEGGFIPKQEIRQRLADVGVTVGTDVAVYSGSGVHSALFIQAMHEAEIFGASMYVGGWSQWSGGQGNPIIHS